MVAGIILIILGVLLIGLVFIGMMINHDKMADDLAWGLGMLAIIGAVMMYNGGVEIDKSSNQQPVIEQNSEK